MAKETIDRIRKAEKAAAGIEQEAKQKAQELIDGARKAAAELMETELERARSEGVSGLQAAEEAGKKAASGMSADTAEELLALENGARAKMEEAAQTILRELVQ
ncbi:hypothetical protein [Lachnoclostridium sp. Marseille-P6806]|uniref:hypothetical protein n=1 Tax=Lachnoclostridium sp. Marseille-P6806 TaxID=2364793 RepID=UPI001031E4E4|nr:hypothetical protein [Lachnoclostridium sp. Marseille-P6806]